MTTAIALPKSKMNWLILFTWVAAMMASDLPNAIWQAVFGEQPGGLFWVKVGLLLAVVLAGSLWKPIQAVRTYFFLLLVLMLALWGMNWLRGTAAYLQWERSANWVVAMAGFQFLKLLVTAIMVVVLVFLGKKPAEYYLGFGQLKAPAKASKGNKNPGKLTLTWGMLGLILGVCIAPLTVLFFGMGNLPSLAILVKALPFFPAALLFAATNAFSEELQFRASLLGELQKVVGPGQAIWLSAAFFGLAHYFGGAPAGIPGVLIAGLLGALFAKCMLGSKGIAVPWFVHFCQNAVIYAFWAIGFVA